MTSFVKSSAASLSAQREAGDNKPSLSLSARPPVGFSPLSVRFVALVTGGSDDYVDFYCAGVEWDWDDGTTSERLSDCDPHEPGKSKIRRRFTVEHVYRQQGRYKIRFKLKQKSRQVGTATTSVEVHPGLR